MQGWRRTTPALHRDNAPFRKLHSLEDGRQKGYYLGPRTEQPFVAQQILLVSEKTTDSGSLDFNWGHFLLKLPR